MKKSRKILTGIFATMVLLYIALIVVAYLPLKTVPAKSLAGKDDKFINVNGINIRYVKQGEGKPVIFVHGMGCSVFSWRNVLPLLSDRYAVYALDLPGFGLSDKPSNIRYDLKSQGNFVIAFMDALKIPSATLVGHSMGGVIVGYAAANFPSRVDSVVLNDAGFYSGGAPEFLKYLFFPLDRLSSKQFFNRKFEKIMLEMMFFNKSLVTDEVIDAYLVAGKTHGAVDAMTKMMHDEGPIKYEGISERITAPTLIVWGKNDEGVHPEDAERLHREIRNSKEVVYIDNCGHMVPDEKPEKLAEAIRDFLG